VPLPGVTVDMLDWWFAWHSLADMHYGIWYQPGHFAISISAKSRAKLEDPRVPIKEKIYGRTDHVVEDVGTGPEDIYIYFCHPAELGFDMDRFKPPAAPVMMLPHGIKVPEVAIQGLAEHNVREFTNLSNLLPQI
jgi:hypothetical protein